MPSFGQVIVWIVVGLVGGALASRLVTWDQEGFGRWRNLGLGLVGALVGGFLFRMLGLFPELDKYSVSLRDVVAAVIGSLIVLGALNLLRSFIGRRCSMIERRMGAGLSPRAPWRALAAPASMVVVVRSPRRHVWTAGTQDTVRPAFAMPA